MNGSIPVPDALRRPEVAEVRRLATALSDVDPETMCRAVIIGACYGRPEGVTKEEINRLCDWALLLQTYAALLASVLAGVMSIHSEADGDEPEFALTELGKQHVELMKGR